ncbi:MAG: hypothetical protein R6U98_03485 [Pirellulaceae bacterium]
MGALATADDGLDSPEEYGGYCTEGGWGVVRVPAIDEVGGFLSPQLNQLDPGNPHPVLLQPVVQHTAVSATIPSE